jgi:hypothetical protein
VKRNNLKKGIFTALLLVSSVVTAENKYPASDFQPKVVYQDSNYKHSETSTSSATSFGEQTKDDSNYPAATYKPEVLFHDTNYKHDTKISNIASSENELEISEAPESTSSNESVSPILALIILAVAVFLFRKKSGLKAGKSNSDELTGVAKYLKNKTPKLSSVAKYLEAHQPIPKSGVAKYVARRVVEVKKAAAEKTTGVEKYMRKKG